MTQDDDSVVVKDDSPEEDSMAGCQSSSNCAIDLADSDSRFSASFESGRSDCVDGVGEGDAHLMIADLLEDTMDSRYQGYIKKLVAKGFWFQGRVTSLDVVKRKDGREVVLICDIFDDGDTEDYKLHEWMSQLVLDDASTGICKLCHPLGAIAWKKFYLYGKVTCCCISEFSFIDLAVSAHQ